MPGGRLGYQRQFKMLRDFLKAEFGHLIHIQEAMDKSITGNFEVIITNTNTLIHSKKHGQGKAETQRERALIVEQIREALENV
ncbi:hypothetical protein ACHAXS_001629 [Conticribra weissflogii]